MQKEYGQQSAKPLAFLFGKKAHAGRYDDRRAGFAAIPLHFGGSKPFDIGLGYLRGAQFTSRIRGCRVASCGNHGDTE
jgi:hypothetical protein